MRFPKWKSILVVGVFVLAFVTVTKQAQALDIVVGDNIFTTVNTATAIPGVSISGDEAETTPVKIYVTNGTLNLSVVSGVTMSGNGTATVNLSGTVTNLNTALATLTYTRNSTGSDTLEITLVGANDIFFSDNNHLYRFVSSGLSWSNAKTAASELTAYGATGYLATITSLAENNFVYARITGDGWLGATDMYNEKTWIWDTGPESGTHFFTENASDGGGNAVDGRFHAWASDEPNDWDIGEDCGYMFASAGGTWNDYPCNTVQGYVVEFGDDDENMPAVVAENITITTSDNPVATSFSPADGATGVSLSANLVLGFSRNVTIDTGNILLRKTADDSIVETIDITGGKITGSGTNSITLNPDTILDELTGYYVTIPGTALRDGSNNYYAGISNSTTWNFTTGDFTNPVISAVSSGTPTSTGTTITWSTDENSSTRVSYGLTSSYGTNTSETNTSPRVTSHSVTLSSLLPCTTYHYQVRSIDGATNTATSVDNTFTTTGCTASQTPSTTTSSSITASSGGSTSLTQDSRQLSVETPADFTDAAGSVVIQIKSINASPVITSLGRPATVASEVGSIVFDVKAIINGDTILDSFDAPVTITYQYSDDDVSNLDESTFWLYHYHNGGWEALDACTINTSTNTISCTTDSFSIFGLFGNLKASSTTSRTNSHSSFTCNQVPPANTPDLFQIDVSSTKATLYFTPLLNNVTNYYISYGHTADDHRFGVFTDLGASTGVLAYTVNDLSPNTTYYFSVRPHNDCAVGEWSNQMKITTGKSAIGGKRFYKHFLARLMAVFPQAVTELKTTPLSKSAKDLDMCEYVVQPGDSLWKISQERLQAGSQYAQIQKDNNLSSSLIQTNQILQVACGP